MPLKKKAVSRDQLYRMARELLQLAEDMPEESSPRVKRAYTASASQPAKKKRRKRRKKAQKP
jgi:hypothetical protein